MKHTNLNSSNNFPWYFDSMKLWLENAAAVKMTKIVDEDKTERLVLYKKITVNGTTSTS